MSERPENEGLNQAMAYLNTLTPDKCSPDVVDMMRDTVTFLKTSSERRMNQMENTVNTLRLNTGTVDMNHLLAVADASPTAQSYIMAGYCFMQARDLLDGPDVAEPYTDVRGLHLIAEGLTHENSMMTFVEWNVPHMQRFLETHIELCPNDYAARLVQHRFHLGVMKDEEKIRDLEMLAHDMELDQYDSQGDFEQGVMITLYTFLAFIYTMTDQHQRAINTFEKCLKLNPNDYDSIYGITFNLCISKYEDGDTLAARYDPASLEESEALCKKYLSLAPKCAKKFPAVLYQLAYICILKNRRREYLSYYEDAVEQEALEMPYNRKVETAFKTYGTLSYKMIRKEICFNPTCPEEESVPVKMCTGCHEAVYCGRTCQSQHRRVHKKQCKKAQR